VTNTRSDSPLASVRERGIGLFVRGLGMGAANVVPGVSGGTIALITGIYDELITTVASIDTQLARCFLAGRVGEGLRRLNAGFLLPLVVGMVAAIVGLARIAYLLETHPEPIWGFFTGLILASALAVVRHVGGWRLGGIVALLGGLVIGYVATFALPLQTGPEWWKYMLAGAAASVAMILPGISGSILLILLGKWQQVMAAINSRDPYILTVFAIGFAIGIGGFSRLLKRLLANHHATTMSFLVGLMTGSLRKVWPFQESLADPGQAANSLAAMSYECVLPAAITSTVVVTMGLMAVGFALVIAVERVARSREDAAVGD